MTSETTKATILLVDDEPQVRRLTRKMLEMNGYEVLECEGGDQALKLFKQHKGSIDMLVSDIQMPGINGIQLAAQIEQEQPGIRVLMITGYAGRYDNDTRHPILGKPYSINTLREKVSQMLAQSVPSTVSA